MQANPIVFEETRNRDSVPYLITVRGRSGAYHAEVKCPECETTDVISKVATKASATNAALAAIDLHHSANHSVGCVSLR